LATLQDGPITEFSANTHEHTPYEAVSSRLWDVLQRDIFDQKAARKLQPLGAAHEPNVAQRSSDEVDEDMLDKNTEEEDERDILCSDSEEDSFDVAWDRMDALSDRTSTQLRRHVLEDGPEDPLMLHQHGNGDWLGVWNEPMNLDDVTLECGHNDAIIGKEDAGFQDDEAELLWSV